MFEALVNDRISSTEFSIRPSYGRTSMPLVQKGTQTQATGRSRGGLSSKIQLFVDALGNPLRFRLTPGQRHHINQATRLLGGFVFSLLVADKAYDDNDFIAEVEALGCVPAIPPRSCSARAGYDIYFYKERHLVECLVSKPKEFRSITTR